jgi:cold shock CspA family protein
MATGTVKWFNPTNAMGSFSRKAAAKMCSYTSVPSNMPDEGQTVQYEIESSRGKESAINLKVSR